MKKILKDDMKSFLQKQPHRLTMAKHSLGIHQLRIVTRLIEKLQPNMSMEVDFLKKNEDLVVKVDIRELVVQRNVKPLRRALDGLMKKIVRIYHHIVSGDMTFKTIEIGMPLLLKYKYEHGSNFVELTIGKELLPQFTDLARGYTKYSLQVAFNTSSPNVFRMYQFISQFRDKKQIQFNVSSLKQWLEIEEKYAMPSKIKERVLNPAMRELKEKADVWFDIAERVTEGRKMKGWKFNIYTKEQTKKAQQLADLKAKEASVKDLACTFKIGGTQEDPAKRERRELKEKLIYQYKLSSNQADKLLSKVCDPRELNNILYGIQLRMVNQKINNIGGYAVKVLTEHFDVKL